MNWTKSEWFKNICLWVSFIFFYVSIQPMAHGLPQPNVEFDFGPSEARARSPDWLASTVDANHEDRFIQAKIAQLAPGVNAAFAFVRDQIRFEPYKGSLRGARGTLWSEAGNSLDKASLLVALLRGQNIPCRYVQGTLAGNAIKTLLQSMFDPLLMANAVGYVPPDRWPTADPVNSLIYPTWVEDHWWVELQDGTQLDPCFGTPMGAAVSRHFEVPDTLRHKVTVRLKAEIYNMLSQMNEQTPLEQTFATVDVYGKSLTLGHFVNFHQPPALIGGFKTYTYSPYIIVDDNDGDPGNNHLIRGTDYQEFFNNLIVMANMTLTRLTLEMEVLSPGKAAEISTRDLLDRVGYAARRGLAQPGPIDTEKPALTEYDLVSLYITPGFLDWEAVSIQQETLTALSAEVEALSPQIDAIQAVNPSQWTSEDHELVNRYSSLNRSIQGLGLGITTGIFLFASDESTKTLRRFHMTHAYYDSPRLTLCFSGMKLNETGNDAKVRMGLDLRRNRIQAIPYPGQNAAQSFLFNFAKGRRDSFLEHKVMELTMETGTAGARFSAAPESVWQAAQAQGIPIALLNDEADIVTQLEGLDISPEARARIADALRSGRAVNVPVRMVSLDGSPSIAWFEIDKTTGEVVSVTEDGGHQAATEFVIIAALVFFSALLVVFIFGGKIANFFNTESTVVKATKSYINSISFANRYKNSEAYKTTVAQKAFMTESYPVGGLTVTKNGDNTWSLTVGGKNVNVSSEPMKGVANSVMETVGTDGSIIDYRDTNMEVISLLNPGQDNVAGQVLAGSGITLETVAERAFVVKAGESQVPSGFRARITNTGASTTFTLGGSAPAGWTVLTAREESPIPAGVTGEVSVFLRPDEGTAMPAPGTTVSFSVQAARKNDPSSALTQNVDFVMPEVHGLLAKADPLTLYSTPTGAADSAFTLANVGNVAETVTLALALPANLAQGGLVSPLSLAPGQTETAILSFTAQGLPIDTDQVIRLTAAYGASGELTKEITLRLRISAPGSLQSLNASNTAKSMGRTELSKTLESLGQDLSKLYQDPASTIYRSRVTGEMDALAAQCDDPLLAAFAPDLQALKTSIASAAPTDLPALLDSLGALLTGFESRLAALAEHNFEISLQPNTAVALPATPTVFTVVLRNTGSKTTTYDLTLSGLPTGVTGTLTPAAITLAPGEKTDCLGCQSVTATLTQPSGKLTTFDFDVTAVVNDAPDITRKVQGAFTLREELVQVVAVPASPPFIEPGGQVLIAVRILNAVNQDRTALLTWTVKDAAGAVVFTSTPQQIALTVLSSLATFPLGTLDTTGFARGTYTIEVRATELGGQLIQGGEGSGSLLVGLPVTASLAVSPETLPQGQGTVTTTLQVTSSINYSQPTISLMGLVDTDGDALSVAFYGNYAYVGGTTGITTVDISDPLNPSIAGTFGASMGSGNVKCRVQDDRLYIASTSKLYVYGLSDPANPSPLGDTNGGYNYLTGAFIRGHHAYTSTNVVAFTSYNIICVGGNFLSYDVSDPAHPSRAWALSTGSSCYGAGGDYAVFQGAAVNDQTALVPSTFSTGSNTNSGQGKLMVVDISNPHSVSVTKELQVPGTVYLVGVAVDGNLALVAGSTTGYPNPGGDFEPTGNLTLTTLNITDPQNPVILKTVNTGIRARASARPSSAGNRYFAVQGGNSKLIVVNANDPQNLVLTTVTAPAQLNEVQAKGNLVYGVSTSGLAIYDIGSIVGTYVTTRVKVPNDGTATIVPGSFNIPPNETLSGVDFDTLIWNHLLSAGRTSQAFSWQSTLPDLKVGEARKSALGATVDFVAQGSPGRVEIGPVSVAVDQILALSPGSRTVRPGEAASYVVTVKNPTMAAVSYDLSLQGVAPGWATWVSSTLVPAQSAMDVPLVLQSDSFAALGEYGFTITATATTGANGTVHGTIILQGLPLVHNQANGVVVALTPSLASAGRGTAAEYVVRLTNTGNVQDSYDLTLSGLPAAIASAFGSSPVDVPPGLDNYREVRLTLTPSAGTTAGAYPFTVRATSRAKPAVFHEAGASLTVLSYGVTVAFAPTSGPPGSTFNATVTNTGTAADTFDLSLGGSAAPASTLNTSFVALGSGAFQVIPVSVGTIDFAYAGALDLTLMAQSRAASAVKASATAQVAIAASLGVTASFTPDSADVTAPGSAAFLLTVRNTGNTEDAYSCAITKVSGAVAASLRGLDGQPTQTIARFRLPGLATGAVLASGTLLSGIGGKVTVTVTSLTDGTVKATATAVLGVGNEPPIAEAGPDQSVHIGQTVELDGSTSHDPDQGPSPLTFAWSFVSVPAGSTLTDLDFIGRTSDHASFEPDRAGTYIVRLTVSDSEAQGTDDVRIDVLNDPPMANAGLDKNVLTAVEAGLNGSDSYDPEGQLIAYLWSFESVPVGSTITNASLTGHDTPNPSFTPDKDGLYTLKLVVNDGQADSDPSFVVLHAYTINCPPNARAGRDQDVAVGSYVVLDGSRSDDPDNLPAGLLTYAWTFTSVPLGSTLSREKLEDSNQVNPSFVPDVAGEYILELSVSDGQFKDTDQVTVTAWAGTAPPEANAGEDQYIEFGDPVALDGTGSVGPEGAALDYEWLFVSLPEGSHLKNTNIQDRTAAEAAFTPDVAGSYVLELRVIDGSAVDFDHVLVVATTEPGLRVWPPEGTIGTRFALTGEDFGALKGKLKMGGKPLKPLSWTAARIEVLMKKAVPPAVYDINVLPKKPKGGVQRVLVRMEAFRVKPPEITEVSPGSAAAGTTIKIKGKFFGSKKPKVYVGSLPCKVTSPAPYMDPVTNRGEVFCTLPKTVTPGTYTLTVVTKVGKGKKGGFVVP